MKKNSVCCTPYLWNHTSYDCYLWYTFVNDISRCFFNFKILIFWVVRGPKWQNFLSAAPYILGTIYHVILIYGTHVSFFFFPFKMLIFGIIRGGGKRAKNSQKWQKILSVPLSISGTKHHMIVIYGMHIWNDDISNFFHFSKFWFWGSLGG